MSKPKLFIGSSQKNLRVASLLAAGLEDCSDVTIWNEGVFGLNRGNLENLLNAIHRYDFAAFILAADDLTTSKDETRPSPRDNVLFESGLFMGVLGRDNVFLVHDVNAGLKIPSDLAGVTLATFDGERVEASDGASAVREACMRIGDRIRTSRFPHMVGEWSSIYAMTTEDGFPLVEEVVEIRPSRDGITIATRRSGMNDHYTAFGRLPQERQIIGEWKSREQDCDTSGTFMLIVSPSSKYMYGYFTSPDENGGITCAAWVLARKDGASDAEVDERLRRARDLLAKTTIGIPALPSAPAA